MKRRKDPGKLRLAIAAAIRKIPHGKVSTYGAVAIAAGYPRCARHVAKVLRSVPGLPWQRVLGSGGRISLTGEHAHEQRLLLQWEGILFKGKCVDMAHFEHKFLPSTPRPTRGRQHLT